ncbi:hypothetical protein Tco_1378534 [Tanacetum coccineum]
MVGTRGSTPEFSGPAFEAAVQRAVDALLPGLTTRLTNEIRQNNAGGSGDQPPTIHTWLERFGKQKPRSFSSATTPVDAENWIAHIEKIFKVLGCADEFKARLESYKLEGDALNCTFPGFVGKKAGPPEEQDKHFKWALCNWILDGIVNTEFIDVAQVANATRNMEILCERSSQNNKRNRDGDRIRPTTQDSNQGGYDQNGYDGRSYDRQGGNSNQKSWQNRGQQYNRSSGSSGQKGYPDYALSPPCDTCGKLYPGKACYRVTGACFTYGSTGHMSRDCPKNGGNGGRGNGNDNQPAAKGRVFSSTKDQAANSSVSVSFAKHISISPTLLNYALSISTPMKSLVIIDHEYHNCLLRFDDKIRPANLFPLDMNDFDIKFWAWFFGVLVLVIISILDSLSLLKSLPELFELVMEGAYGCILGTLFRSVQMVGTRGSTPKFSGPAFETAVQRAVDALLPSLTTRLTNEIRHNGAGGSWKKVTSLKELVSIGEALNKPNEVRRMWLPCHGRISVTSSFCSTFPGFVGNKAGPPEEQAKHFKWALCDWILDGIVNTEFIDVAQVANATRNMEILCERSS